MWFLPFKGFASHNYSFLFILTNHAGEVYPRMFAATTRPSRHPATLSSQDARYDCTLYTVLSWWSEQHKSSIMYRLTAPLGTVLFIHSLQISLFTLIYVVRCGLRRPMFSLHYFCTRFIWIRVPWYQVMIYIPTCRIIALIHLCSWRKVLNDWYRDHIHCIIQFYKNPICGIVPYP